MTYNNEVARPTREILGNNVLEFRKAAGLTQQELAELVGVHKSTISRVERHLEMPSAVLMWRIAKELGEPVGHIFFQEGVV